MASEFEFYVSGDSWIHRLDPRTKMAFVATSFILILPADRLVFVVGYLLVVHLLLWQAGIPEGRIGWLWKQLWPVSLLILVLWPLSNPTGHPALLEWWKIRITVPAIWQGLLAALRIDALAFAVFVLLLTTVQSRMVQGLVRLGLPFEWGLGLAIGLRYVPLLRRQHDAIVDAQRARGWTPERDGLLRRLRANGPILVALMIGALRLTDSLTLALTARGFRPGGSRTNRRPLRLGRADRICLIGLAVLLVGSIGRVIMMN